MNLRLKQNEVDAFDRRSTAVQLSDGSGDYVGTLNVYHVRIVKTKYPD